MENRAVKNADGTQTVRLYEEDAYGKEFDASVLAVSAERKDGRIDVVLDRTTFFPEGGGQTSDVGTIRTADKDGAWTVEDVQVKDGVIHHICRPSAENGETALFPGDRVSGRIDWAYRFSNMQNHTGEHILSGLIHLLYGYDNVGFRLSPHTVTLDFNGHLSEEQLEDLEKRANTVVWENRAVSAQILSGKELEGLEYRSKLDLTENVRIVTIDGVDACACCAPHVRRTGEIGQISILDAVASPKGTRLTIACGARALKEAAADRRRVDDVSHMTSRKREEVPEAVRGLQEELAAKQAEIRLWQDRFAQEKIQAGGRYFFFEELDPLVQRETVNRIASEGKGCCGVFVGADDTGYRYVIARSTGPDADPGEDARTVQKILGELGAKGGGSPDMVQGRVKADETAIRRILS